MTGRKPQDGGRAKDGPFDGRVLAYDKPMMPIKDNTGKRIGAYFWDKDHWEYEEEDGQPTDLYPF